MSRPRAFMALALAALSFSGCAGRGATLGTSSSPCFRALPAAAQAVGHQGRFLGVRLVAADRLRRRVPEAGALGRRRVCLVAYQGAYRPGDVKHPLDASNGPYVLVAVEPDGSSVLGSIVVGRLPLAFRDNL